MDDNQPASTTPAASQAAAQPSYSRDTLRYINSMKFFGVVYIAVGLAFFFIPNQLFYVMNLPTKLGLLEPIAESAERFWLVMTSAMMAMLAALSFLAAESPGIRGYALVHILSKTVSIAGFLYAFINHGHCLAYLIGAATDLPIALYVTWITIANARTGTHE